MNLMDYSYSLKPAKRTVVDIPATSRLLKELRNKNGYSVKQLQEIFGVILKSCGLAKVV